MRRCVHKELGRTEEVQRYASDVIELWGKSERDDAPPAPDTSHTRKEQASVLAIAYCMLASLSLDAGRYEQAFTQVTSAMHLADKSHDVRQAETHLLYGRILQAMQRSEEARQAFRRAVECASTTASIVLQISTRTSLAAHLLKREQQTESEAELKKVQELLRIVALQRAEYSDETGIQEECLRVKKTHPAA